MTGEATASTIVQSMHVCCCYLYYIKCYLYDYSVPIAVSATITM